MITWEKDEFIFEEPEHETDGYPPNPVMGNHLAPNLSNIYLVCLCPLVDPEYWPFSVVKPGREEVILH